MTKRRRHGMVLNTKSTGTRLINTCTCGSYCIDMAEMPPGGWNRRHRVVCIYDGDVIWPPTQEALNQARAIFAAEPPAAPRRKR